MRCGETASTEPGEGCTYLELEAIIDEGEQAIESELRRRGKDDVFTELKVYLSESGRPGYASLARRLNASVGSLCTDLKRARAHFRGIVRSRLSAA